MSIVEGGENTVTNMGYQKVKPPYDYPLTTMKKEVTHLTISKSPVLGYPLLGC